MEPDSRDARGPGLEVGPEGAAPGLAVAAGAAPEARRRRLHPFFQDLTVTLFAQVAVALGGLLLYRLLAINTGTDGFASYSLVRQSVGFLFPIVTVGLVGGLPRYLALPRDQDGPTAEAYLGAAVLISGAATVLTAGLALALPGVTAEVLFGESERSELVGPFAAFLGATAVFYVAYGYYRGLFRFRRGSLLQVLGIGASPSLVLLAFPDEPIGDLVLLMAAAIASLSLVAVCVPLARSLLAANRRRVAVARRALFRYGFRRVPGELAQLGIFVLVPILAAQVSTLTDVAYLSAGQQVLAVVSLAVWPLGLILLPALAKMWEEDRERASAYVAQLSAFALHVALFLSFQAVLFADIGVGIWLGSEFDAAASVVRVTVAPAALFVLYLMLRGTLDAVLVKSYNSRNNLIAFAVFAAVAAVTLGLDLMRPVMCVAWAFAAGVTVQGVLTFATVHRLFSVRATHYVLGLAVPLALSTAAAGLAARPLIDASSLALPLLLGLESALAGIYFGFLFFARVPWTAMLRERFLQRG